MTFDQILGIGGIATSLLDSFIGLSTNRNKKLMRYQTELNNQTWEHQFETINAYNSPSAQMKRFTDAGLNPNLIYGEANMSGASPSGGTSLDASQAQSNLFGALSNYQNIALQREQLKSVQMDNTYKGIVNQYAQEKEQTSLDLLRLQMSSQKLSNNLDIIASQNQIAQTSSTMMNQLMQSLGTRKLTLSKSQTEYLGKDNGQVQLRIRGRQIGSSTASNNQVTSNETTTSNKKNNSTYSGSANVSGEVGNPLVGKVGGSLSASLSRAFERAFGKSNSYGHNDSVSSQDTVSRSSQDHNTITLSESEFNQLMKTGFLEMVVSNYYFMTEKEKDSVISSWRKHLNKLHMPQLGNYDTQ